MQHFDTSCGRFFPTLDDGFLILCVCRSVGLLLVFARSFLMFCTMFTCGHRQLRLLTLLAGAFPYIGCWILDFMRVLLFSILCCRYARSFLMFCKSCCHRQLRLLTLPADAFFPYIGCWILIFMLLCWLSAFVLLGLFSCCAPCFLVAVDTSCGRFFPTLDAGF